MARILVFGDSITYGAWDAMRGGWADRLKSFCMERELENPEFDYPVYNLGISGDNSREMVKRFEFEASQRLEEDEPIIIFAIGINDSQFVKSEDDFRVPKNEFRKNIEQLIKFSRKFSSKIVFIGLTAVDELKVNPNPWDNNKSYKNEYIEKYDFIIKSICKEKKIHFINIYEEFNKLDYKKLLEDGLHPNSEGHKKIFEIVRDFLMERGIVK